MIRALAILLLIAASPMASAKKYAEPDGESAGLRVRLANPESYSVHIAEYDPMACKKSADVGWVSGGRKIDSVRIGMPEAEAPQEGILERRIPVGRPFAFGTSFIMPKQSILLSLMGATNPAGASATALDDAMAAICEAPVFTAMPGEYYVLHLQPLPQSCKSELFRIQMLEDGTVRREPVDAPRIRFPVSINKPACPALSP